MKLEQSASGRTAARNAAESTAGQRPRGGAKGSGMFAEKRPCGHLRQRFARMTERAAEAGWQDAEKLWHMTPREIELAFKALAAQERRRMARADALAWLMGRYAAIAWHAPRRYPHRPDGVVCDRPPMREAEMKRVLLNIARRRGAQAPDA